MLLQPPPAPPRVPKHPRWVYHTLLPPKYKKFLPKIAPHPVQCAQQWTESPDCIVVVYLHVPAPAELLGLGFFANLACL